MIYNPPLLAGMQFLTGGVVLGLVGASQYYLCINSIDIDCAESGYY